MSLLLVLLSSCGGTVRSQASSGPVPQETTEAQLVRTNNVGVALMEQLKFEEAVVEFQKALSLSPEFVPAWVNTGIAQYYAQQSEDALRSFQKAIELDPAEVRSHYMSGLIYRNQAETPDALASFRKAAELDPHDASTNYYLGLLYRRDRQFEKAIFHLKKTVEREPYNASAHYNLAIALRGAGLARESGQALQMFQRLQGQFGTETIGLQYLEQGRYSTVIDQLGRYLEPVPPSPPSEGGRFREVSRELGLSAQDSPPSGLSSSGRRPEGRASHLGGSVSFGDFDGDGWVDLMVASPRQQPACRLYRNREGRFQDVTSAAGLAGVDATVALWGDVDNDEDLDLYLIRMGPDRLYLNQGDRTFRDGTSAAGVDNPLGGTAGTTIDYDHDGDLDLFVANRFLADPEATDDLRQGDAPNTLLRNNGDGTFTDVSADSGIASNPGASTAVFVTDFNNSRDIDLVVLNSGGPVQVLSNQRDGTFKGLDLMQDVRAVAGAVGDINGDGWIDLFLGSDGATAEGRLYRGDAGLGFRTQDPPLFGTADSVASQFLDYDNDGDQDLILTARTGTTTAIRLYRNHLESFTDVSDEVGLTETVLGRLQGLSVADIDNDGDLDFAVSVESGGPLLFRNETASGNNWLQVDLKGTNSNRFGIGAKVEVLAGRLWQKVEVTGGHGHLSQSSPLVHFGLGRNRPDAVRILWPGGVLQSEIDPAINSRIPVFELDRKGTSCPILYVWDGTRYRFHTDFLGGSAFGSLVAPGVYNVPDTDESIKLERAQVGLRDGQVAVTLNNQLEEVIFFDELKLLVVDHPPDFDVVPDEKLLPGPPYEPFRLLSLQDPRPPLEAVDGSGQSVLAQIASIDRTYPQNFERLPFKGYATPHELVLDLGDTPDQQVLLLMHAWIDYADSTSNLAAWQAGVELIPPYLQVQDESGAWVTVIPHMGFPAGLPKPMTVDLTGKFLSDSRKVKIVTNMRIYWDQILVDSAPPRTDWKLTSLNPSYANLQFGGFPAFHSPDGKAPKVYDASRRSPSAPWKTHIGAYTRYGDVRPLLETVDDMYVITRSGDELEVYFDVSGLDPPPPGWIRDYLVRVDGFGKDMDVNSAYPDYVGPLPFHGMPRLLTPDGPAYPLTPRHLEYLREWNTRVVDQWVPALRPAAPLD